MRGLTCAIAALTSTGLLLTLGSGLSGQSASAQAVLPACGQELGVEYVFPSPRFDQDATLFWTDSWSLFRSLDDGSSWLQVFLTTQDPDIIWIEQFQVSAHTDDPQLDIFIGVHDASFGHYYFFQSGDSGDKWQERTPACSPSNWVDCPHFALRAAGQTPTLFQPRWWYFGWSPLPFGIARSESGGLNWEMVWEETDALSVAVSPDYDNDQTIWASLIGYSTTLDDDFILSHDGGETWQAAGQGLCDVAPDGSDLQVSPGYARDRTLLMGFYRNSLFQSKDGGLTWQAIFPRGSTPVCDSSLTAFAELEPRFAPDYPDDPTLYVATNHGLYASYDDGQSWRQLTVSGTVFSLEVARQANAPTIEPVGVEEPVSEASSRVDSGALFQQVFLPRVDASGTPTPARPYSLFMRAYVTGTSDAYMYRSDDGGATWECMERPQVRRRMYLPLLHVRED